MNQKNCMVAQSGGPTVAINASLAGVIDGVSDSSMYDTVYGSLNGITGILNDDLLNLTELMDGHPEYLSRLAQTPAMYLGSCRYKLPNYLDDDSPYVFIFKQFETYHIEAFFYIGGNDSMDTIKKLAEYANKINSDITFMGVPKTIDNDLDKTDHTPGYGSAAKYVASAMKEIILDTDTYTTDSITIVEIMGRNAGWLTASSALARTEDCTGPDLIYLPETPFSYDKFVSDILEVKKHKSSAIIALSEGVRNADGQYICETQKDDMKLDVFGHKMLGETALFLSDMVGKDTGMKSRGIVFSTLQRCASHIVSRRDITEAYDAGATAVAAALAGETGKMVIFKRISNEPYKVFTETHDIGDIANVEKTVPKEWITQNGTYVSQEFIDYARPLIIGELTPFMVDGLPRHLTIE